ncbi:hypothetical protein [Legionella micdadei]|uniref:Uncharacterized protein n=1 Tax=Legionella micdadei TaxID=451 RepID=A0A098GAJ4_LEGMI|nr:hypothetical protein [Legionella micdadei]ARG96315.1 hypothetical protein B6N58_00660 [Legionella micdadei]ARG99070.1 hypothetical protein B6V88_00660 [Legionella micdadei]KTD29768.1 hypothetical protein Lmic_0493 [Legionella micdadei]NSL19428.1 hypothetical protein [Legionella micdadei]CEG59509.1 conserved protein of unknown function [Legionella micdadei]
MATTKKGDYIGYSDAGINEAIQNALKKAGEHSYFEVIETRGSQIGEDKRQYEATITAFLD